jgi:hypothetical protein
MEITTTYYVGFLLILVLVAYVVVVFYKGPANEKAIDFEKPDGNLSKESVVLDSDATRAILFGEGGSTLMVYIYVKGLDKTAKVNEVSPTILRIPDVLELRCNASHEKVSAELAISTRNTATGKTGAEVMNLPSIPLQKWICFTVLRDGRRFDVMYNDKVVASKRLAHMPAYMSSELRMGSVGALGVYNMGRVFNYRLSFADVKTELVRTSDSRHKPTNAGAGVEMGSIFDIFRCPGGILCRDSTPAPKNPVEVWETPYA